MNSNPPKRKTKPFTLPWATVDWALSDLSISRQIGTNRKNVWQRRRLGGYPPATERLEGSGRPRKAENWI